MTAPDNLGTIRARRRAQRAPTVAFARTGLGIYPVLVTVFCCLLLLSNIAATKGIKFGPFLTDGGAFLFPLTYVLGDVLAEVYGLRATRRAILLGFLMAVLASLTFWLVTISPAAPDYPNRTRSPPCSAWSRGSWPPAWPATCWANCSTPTCWSRSRSAPGSGTCGPG